MKTNKEARLFSVKNDESDPNDDNIYRVSSAVNSTKPRDVTPLAEFDSTQQEGYLAASIGASS